MHRIGVRELRQHASRYLALVKRGETIEVTERGRLIAVLTPPGAPLTERDRLIAAGRLIPAVSSGGRLHDARVPPVTAGEPSNAELLDDGRRERL